MVLLRAVELLRMAVLPRPWQEATTVRPSSRVRLLLLVDGRLLLLGLLLLLLVGMLQVEVCSLQELSQGL